MTLFEHDRPVNFAQLKGAAGSPHYRSKVCLLVHGLGCTERTWHYQTTPDDAQTDYGRQLAQDFGYTPFYLRYNTGRALNDNGQDLATLLAAFCAAYPAPIDDLLLIGHSMGGLVLRHACAIGQRSPNPWTDHVKRVFYLASPHTGAPLARLAQSTTQVLAAIPDPVSRLLSAMLDGRSAGIKDLRHGVAPPPRVHAPNAAEAPFMASAQHFLIAGTITNDATNPLARFVGDGLVEVPAHTLDAGAKMLETRVFGAKDHLQLAHDPDVYAQIAQWCNEEAA